MNRTVYAMAREICASPRGRQALEAFIETLIAALDDADGDPDLEADADFEPDGDEEPDDRDLPRNLDWRT